VSLKEISLGDEGLDYVASCLRGETGLSSKIPRELERGGYVFTPLPAETSRERALQFEVGGLTSMRETYAWFARHLEQLSSRSGNGSLVFQDVWLKQRDVLDYPHNFAEAGNTLFFDQSSVYYVLDLDKIDAVTISLAVGRITSFQFVAVFSNFNFRAADIPPTRVVAETLIDEIAHGAQEVFVSAYDQEGLVVWRRQVAEG